MNITIEFCIFNLAKLPNFTKNWQFFFFYQFYPRRVFPVENRKSEHHHWILHIWISLGTKFQLKLTILIFFWPIYLKREFPVKKGKITLVHASMVVTYYIKLFHIGSNRQQYFNVSSPSSHSDKNKSEWTLCHFRGWNKGKCFGQT